jgi:HlyD family secretion protein
MRFRSVLLLVLALAVVGTGATLFFRAGAAPATAAGADVHVVSPGAVELTLKETGVVKPRQSVAVKSKVSGKVRQVLVAEGDRVTAGQLVAVVEPDAQASLTLSEKRMELRRLRLDLDQKEREYRREKRLASEGLVPSKVSEEAERDWRTAENFFSQAKTALNLLEREANQPETRVEEAALSDPAGLTDYRILAPIEGIVASVKVKPGELATSGTTGFSQEGALLMEIADQTRLEVVVNINEIDVPKVTPGMPAKVTLAARPAAVAARVDRVAVAPAAPDPAKPAGQSDARGVIVYPVALTLDSRPPELRQGMSASVDLTLERKDDVLRIPVLAFGEKDGKTIVKLRKDAKTFEDREVTLGLKGEKFVEVKDGLAAKDVIAARFPSDADKKKPGGR